MLDSFIHQLHKRADVKTSVRLLRAAFLAMLPIRERSCWPRWRFIEGLESAGLIVGTDSNRVLVCVGVSLEPLAGWVRDDNGRVTRQK